MPTTDYMSGRVQYKRPQAVLFSDTPGRVVSGQYLPDESAQEFVDFLILSDHNRKPINMDYERIEQRKRMINGRMRSVHIADKRKISLSWDKLPSRAFAKEAGFDAFGKPTNAYLDGNTYASMNDYKFTVDGGAGGVELRNWYQEHPGSFWVFLAYDNYQEFSGEVNQFSRLQQYNERIEMYFSDFSYEVENRGGTSMDLCNISLSLEEA
jgi:hypothetical protein